MVSVHQCSQGPGVCLKKELPLTKKAKYDYPLMGRIFRKNFEHPIAAKVVIIAVGILLSPLLLPFSFIVGLGALAIGVFNGYTSSDSLKKIGNLIGIIFPLLVPRKHDMAKDLVFTEGTGPNGKATVKYEGCLPVLHLDTAQNAEDYRTLGYDHGYLLAEPIKRIVQTHMGSLLWLLFPEPKKVPFLTQKLIKSLPPEYLNEMDGIVEGFNARMEELKQKDRLTREKIMLLQLVPDMHHSTPRDLERALSGKQTKESLWFPKGQPVSSLGCTTVLDFDEDGNVVFGRNMDWPTLNVAGTYSYLVRRSVGEKKIMEIGIPGQIGSCTAMSSTGLALAMNICEGTAQNAKEGLPACILNRLCIDQCSTVDEIEALIGKHPPIGPYHLSVAEGSKATAFHLYQGQDNKHYKRTLEKGMNEPVVTTNCRYKETGPYKNYGYSYERERNIKRHFERNKGKIGKEELVGSALKLPMVNNNGTAHHVRMHPAKGIMHVAFDNAFAGDNDFHTIAL